MPQCTPDDDTMECTHDDVAAVVLVQDELVRGEAVAAPRQAERQRLLVSTHLPHH